MLFKKYASNITFYFHLFPNDKGTQTLTDEKNWPRAQQEWYEDQSIWFQLDAASLYCGTPSLVRVA